MKLKLSAKGNQRRSLWARTARSVREGAAFCRATSRLAWRRPETCDWFKLSKLNTTKPESDPFCGLLGALVFIFLTILGDGLLVQARNGSELKPSPFAPLSQPKPK